MLNMNVINHLTAANARPAIAAPKPSLFAFLYRGWNISIYPDVGFFTKWQVEQNGIVHSDLTTRGAEAAMKYAKHKVDSIFG